jgi:phosphopentomutase
MKVYLVVIDSFGMGALPDAETYGDGGSNTALSVLSKRKPGSLPFLEKAGLGNAALLNSTALPGCPPAEKPAASYGLMAEQSPGKDTTTGHWEMAGIILEKAFTTFPPSPPSFPEALTAALSRLTGKKIIGNKAASGTEIIEELGAEHIQTGSLICYTSSDSVFQIAAHEDIIPVDELYKICSTARTLCDPYQIGRVIARPFTGKPGAFIRTERRHDYSIALPRPALMDHLKNCGITTIAVGKISDIFNGSGISVSYPDKGNEACIKRLLSLPGSTDENSFAFINLVDTDMVYGHRRDVDGYFNALKEIDTALAEFSSKPGTEDVLIITADHGCDPGFKGSDHTREYVPLLMLQRGRAPADLGIRRTFADTAASVCGLFGVNNIFAGESFINS